MGFLPVDYNGLQRQVVLETSHVFQAPPSRPTFGIFSQIEKIVAGVSCYATNAPGPRT